MRGKKGDGKREWQNSDEHPEVQAYHELLEKVRTRCEAETSQIGGQKVSQHVERIRRIRRISMDKLRQLITTVSEAPPPPPPPAEANPFTVD